MKLHRSESKAIRAGLLTLFDPNDLVMCVLSEKGIKNSPIATKVLDRVQLEKVHSKSSIS